MDASNFRHPPQKPEKTGDPKAADAQPHAAHSKHVVPAQALDHYGDDYVLDTLSFRSTGRLLPALMLSTIPALILLCISTLLGMPWLYYGAAALNVILMVAVTIVLIFSIALGLIHHYSGAHPRPHRTRH